VTTGRARRARLAAEAPPTEKVEEVEYLHAVRVEVPASILPVGGSCTWPMLSCMASPPGRAFDLRATRFGPPATAGGAGSVPSHGHGTSKP
jgi:hypothetical protein